MVLHYSGAEIIEILEMISKNKEFPHMLGKEILEYMKYAGEVRFHLIKGEYFLYTSRDIARRLGTLVKYKG
jgi:hypothetical protein